MAARGPRAPVLSGTLAEPSDAVALARDAVRGLARFFGQHGADTWGEGFGETIRNAARLESWMAELLPARNS